VDVTVSLGHLLTRLFHLKLARWGKALMELAWAGDIFFVVNKEHIILPSIHLEVS
jgi:hypothetical protein